MKSLLVSVILKYWWRSRPLACISKAYFANNAKTEETLKYEEYPVKCRWDYRLHKWLLRARKLGFTEQIGNMIRIHPSVGEKFYFRLLLKNVGGATSYENLKVVNGIQHPTYHSACVALGLARGDRQWIDFIEEASVLHFYSISSAKRSQCM